MTLDAALSLLNSARHIPRIPEMFGTSLQGRAVDLDLDQAIVILTGERVKVRPPEGGTDLV